MTTQTESTSLVKAAAHQVAEQLLEIGAVKLSVDSPFTWVSGIKAPIYCDNRVVNSHVKARRIVTDSFVSEIKENFSDIDVIAGVATGGIPFAAYIADKMEIPMVYVRQEPKEHGLKKQIEGHFEDGANVVLIEDHVSTGGSSKKAIDAIRSSTANFLGMLSIMQYNFDSAYRLFSDNDIMYRSLCDLNTVVQVAQDKGVITAVEAESILRFKEDPKVWWDSKT